MSEDMADEPYNAALEKVDEAHEQAVSDAKRKVGKAKADALKKLSQ